MLKQKGEKAVIIKRVIDSKEIEIELTEEELLEATREHFAKQNEEFIRSFVDEDEEFAQWSDEEKEEMIRDIAWQMVDHIQIKGDDAELFWELAEEYRNKDFDDDCDDCEEQQKYEELNKQQQRSLIMRKEAGK